MSNKNQLFPGREKDPMKYLFNKDKSDTTIHLPHFDVVVADRDGDVWFLRNKFTNQCYFRREVRFLPRGMRSAAAVAGYLYAMAQAAT